jgi:DNA-binding CsgD family transcriptional regulator
MKAPTMELMRPGQALQLGLPERAPDFARLLVAPPLDEVPLGDREWLHERYREIVPIVLLPALVAVEQGTPVPESCLVPLRHLAARAAAGPGVNFSVVLRGAFPALKVFSVVIRHTRSASRAQTVIAMARASHVAYELGSCWAESWAAHRAHLDAADASDRASGAAGDAARDSAAQGGNSIAHEPVTNRAGSEGAHTVGPQNAVLAGAHSDPDTRQARERPTDQALTDAGLTDAGLTDAELADVGLSDVELAAASDALTADEADMLTLAAYGLSNEEIARSTRFSRQTVAWHLSRLMRNWRAPNRTALVAVAFVRGALVARAPRQARRSKIAALPPAPPLAAPVIDTHSTAPPATPNINSTAPPAVPDTTDAAEAS